MIERPKVYVCLNCLHEQAELLSPCQRCGSRRLEHVASLRQRYGDDWRVVLAPDDGHVH